MSVNQGEVWVLEHVCLHRWWRVSYRAFTRDVGAAGRRSTSAGRELALFLALVSGVYFRLTRSWSTS